MNSKDILYLNTSNELILHLAYDKIFETSEECKFRAEVLHELWHIAKIARGESIANNREQ